MTTRIGSGGPSTGITTTPSAPRVTAAPGQPFKSVMSAGASAILQGAEQAVARLPGGPILAAAFRPTPGSVAPATNASAMVPGVGAYTPEGGAGTAGLAAGAAPSGSTPGAENGGIEAALNQSANQNLYYIEVQERISAESRSYSAVSNVLKARHDTVKNAIGNIR